MHELHLELKRLQPVMGDTAYVFRKTCIGDATDDKWGAFRQVTDVLFHLFRAGGAVEPQNVDREGLENRHDSSDVGPHQHGAGGFHGHRNHQRPALASLFEGIHHPLKSRLDLEDVLTGFDDEQVDATHQKALSLLAIRLLQGVEVDVAQGGQFGCGPH